MEFPNKYFNLINRRVPSGAVIQMHQMWKQDRRFKFQPKWILNKERGIAILRRCASYRRRTNRTRKSRKWGAVGGHLYYCSYTTVVKTVRQFFNDPKNLNYNVLLIDICSAIHTTVLYVMRNKPGSDTLYRSSTRSIRMKHAIRKASSKSLR